MLERISIHRLASLIFCCWLSVLPAEGQPADSSFPSSLPPSVRDSTLRPTYPGAPLLLTVPVFDLPYGLNGGLESPSMRQSMYWNAGATQMADQTIGWLWEGVRPGGWRL